MEQDAAGDGQEPGRHGDRLWDRDLPLLLSAVLLVLILGQGGTGMASELLGLGQERPVSIEGVGCTVNGTGLRHTVADMPPANMSRLLRPGPQIHPPVYRVRTNADGFRTSVQPWTPKQGRRVVVIGDSLTWGVGVNRSDLFTSLLEARLRSNGTRPVTVINIAKRGWGIQEYYEVLAPTVLAYEPDHVVIAFDPKDALSSSRTQHWHRQLWQRAPANMSRHERSDWVNDRIQERFEERMRSMRFSNSSIRKNMARIHMLLGRENISHTFVQVMEFSVYDYSHLLAPDGGFAGGPLDRWAERCGIALYGRPDAFRERPETEYTFLPRDWHLNPTGHRIVAEYLYRILQAEGWPQ